MSKHFSDVKDIFQDSNNFDYVTLDKSVLAYEKLVHSLQEPRKLILFYGRPGTGKTYLLRKIYKDLSKKKNLIFFPQPFFDEESFLTSLFEEINNIKLSAKIKSYEIFLRLHRRGLEKENKKCIYTVLLDEAQLYPPHLIEKIRLLADTRLFTFLFTIHKTEKEDVLAKDYFTTRIWESIEMPNSNTLEVHSYLEKKFLFHNKSEVFAMFSPKQIRLIQGLTDGNLRTINKLMYKFFELCEYYENYQPSLVNTRFAKTKYLEMAAIDAELIDA